MLDKEKVCIIIKKKKKVYIDSNRKFTHYGK